MIEITSFSAVAAIVVGWIGSLEARFRGLDNQSDNHVTKEEVRDLNKPLEVRLDLLKETVDNLGRKIDRFTEKK